MKKICIIGHFGFGKDLLNGQTIKTKIITEELEREFHPENITKIDTHGGLRKILFFPFVFFRVLKNHSDIIILPAHNGLRIIAPLISIENYIFHRKIHYVVIGGWLPEYLQKHKSLMKYIQTFHGVYVETKTMQEALKKLGCKNVYIMPNCKSLNILAKSEMVFSKCEPFRLCTFSRVMREKGIEDAVDAIKTVNERMRRTIFSLDIYGQVDSQQEEWFIALERTFPQYITYKGTVSYDESVNVLKNYFALLFPTLFFTEGIPGTIIDAYAAGVPVIASCWENFHSIVDEGKTGLGYHFSDKSDLVELLISIATNPTKLEKLKENCIKKAVEFTPEVAMQSLIERIEQ